MSQGTGATRGPDHGADVSVHRAGARIPRHTALHGAHRWTGDTTASQPGAGHETPYESLVTNSQGVQLGPRLQVLNNANNGVLVAMVGRKLPYPNFNLSEKIFLVRQFIFHKCKIRSKKIFILEKLGAKFKFGAPVISSVLKFAAVCWKIAATACLQIASCFFTQDAAECKHAFDTQLVIG